MNALFEFLPLILFLGAYFYKDIYLALIVLMIAMPIGFVIKYLRTNEFDKMYFWSTIFLLVAGTLTLYFQNAIFLFWKPTAFYWAVAAAFLISQFIGDKPLVQRAFGLIDGFQLDSVEPRQWRMLNLVWVLFFVSMGLLNIYVAYNFEEATWVKFKVFGLMALTFVFMLGQTLWLARFVDDESAEGQEEAD